MHIHNYLACLTKIIFESPVWHLITCMHIVHIGTHLTSLKNSADFYLDTFINKNFFPNVYLGKLSLFMIN